MTNENKMSCGEQERASQQDTWPEIVKNLVRHSMDRNHTFVATVIHAAAKIIP